MAIKTKIKITVHEIVYYQNGEKLHVFSLTDCDGNVYEVVRCKTINACEVN
jgi:hypothetical protein